MNILNREKKSLYFNYIKNFFSDSRPILFFFSTQEIKDIEKKIFLEKKKF